LGQNSAAYERRLTPTASRLGSSHAQEGAENGKLVVRVPSRVFRKRLTETYGELLQAVLVEVGMNDTSSRISLFGDDRLPAGTSAKQRAWILIPSITN